MLILDWEWAAADSKSFGGKTGVKHRKNCETALTPGIQSIPGLWNLAEIVKFVNPQAHYFGLEQWINGQTQN